MPGLVRTEEGVGGCRGVAARAALAIAIPPVTPAPGADRQPRRARPHQTEQTAAAEAGCRSGGRDGRRAVAADDSPRASRRSSKGRSRHSRTVTVSCESGSASALMRSVNSRLSSSVSEEYGDESVDERSVRGERRLERRVPRVDLVDEGRAVVALGRGEVARQRERHLGALDVRGEVPQVGARPPVLFAA